jgi:hypothetical protein
MAEPLEWTDIETKVNEWAERARSFQDTVLSPDRVQAIEYYNGLMRDLPAPEGRSAFVSTEVRDTSRAQLPDLLRIFLGPENIMEFEPLRPELEAEAKQRSEYLNMVLRKDNDAFTQCYSWFKDADLSMGVVKWWWDAAPEVVTHELTGLTAEQVGVLDADDDVGYTVIGQGQVQLDDGSVVPTYDVRVQKVEQRGRAKYKAIPPEDFLFDPDSDDLDTCPFVGHRARMLVHELVAMGYTEDEIDEGRTPADQATEEQQARSPNQTIDPWGMVTDERVDYTEAYILLDRDGTGYASRYKACLIGTKLARLEPWPDVPFAILVVDPTPHTLHGLSLANLTGDLQRLKSNLMRGSLDSLAFAITARTAFQDGQVEVKDLMNPEQGGLIRTYGPPAQVLYEVKHDYVGREVLGMLQYSDEIKENRTGTSKAAAGLDPDALQSSTKAGVAATISGSQRMMYLKAQLYAETGIRRLLMGLSSLLRRHQDFERVVRLTGGWVTVDPRSWTADLPIRLNVALGLGTTEEKLTGLSGIKAVQESVLTQMGPVNPLVSLGQYRHTLAKMVELLGYPSADPFFKQVDDQALEQQAAQAAQQPPEPTPEQVLANAQLQVEQMKAEKDIAIKQQELLLKQQEMALKREDALRTDERERDKTELDAYLRVEEMNLKYQADLQLKTMDVAIEDARQETALATKALDHEVQSQESEKSRQAEASKPQPKPKTKRKVKVVRGEDGKISGAEIVEESEA